MEETAIAFVEDDQQDPPVKTAQQSLPTNIIPQLLHKLQLVTCQLQIILEQRRQQQSHKCGPPKRFQQQPVSPQRCQQPPEEHQMARAASSIEGPAGAVDRSVRSSTRGDCTESRVKKDVQPEHNIPALHPTSPMAFINALAVEGKVGCSDVIKRLCKGHVHHEHHVSKAPDDVTTVHHTTIINKGHIKSDSACNNNQIHIQSTHQQQPNFVESPCGRSATVGEFPSRGTANQQQVSLKYLLDARRSTIFSSQAPMTSLSLRRFWSGRNPDLHQRHLVAATISPSNPVKQQY